MEKKKLCSLIDTFNRVSNLTQKENIEYWCARDIMVLMGYERWENFEKVLNRAIDSCETSKFRVSDHFREVTKVVNVGSKDQREVKDYQLTRYACYLIAQNGDPKKEEIAFAQNYFAVQTRKLELIEDHITLPLSKKIYERGVDDMGFARISSKGDEALFGGISASEMKQRLGVKENRHLEDFLPSLTIAAKDLATAMTNYNVGQKDLYGEQEITTEHVQNNTSVRSILTSRNIQPENLPAKEISKRLKGI